MSTVFVVQVMNKALNLNRRERKQNESEEEGSRKKEGWKRRDEERRENVTCRREGRAWNGKE